MVKVGLGEEEERAMAGLKGGRRAGRPVEEEQGWDHKPEAVRKHFPHGLQDNLRSKISIPCFTILGLGPVEGVEALPLASLATTRQLSAVQHCHRDKHQLVPLVTNLGDIIFKARNKFFLSPFLPLAFS